MYRLIFIRVYQVRKITYKGSMLPYQVIKTLIQILQINCVDQIMLLNSLYLMTDLGVISFSQDQIIKSCFFPHSGLEVCVWKSSISGTHCMGEAWPMPPCSYAICFYIYCFSNGKLLCALYPSVQYINTRIEILAKRYWFLPKEKKYLTSYRQPLNNQLILF